MAQERNSSSLTPTDACIFRAFLPPVQVTRGSCACAQRGASRGRARRGTMCFCEIEGLFARGHELRDGRCREGASCITSRCARLLTRPSVQYSTEMSPIVAAYAGPIGEPSDIISVDLFFLLNTRLSLTVTQVNPEIFIYSLIYSILWTD